MSHEMQARIMFDTPEDMAVGKAELIRRGFRVETLDTVDPEGGPYVWVMAYVDVDYAEQDRFSDWVRSLSLGGDVIEAGHSIRTRREQGSLVETPEKFARAQALIEQFARRANDVKRAVETLERAFKELSDWPYALGAELPQLKQTANASPTSPASGPR
jgi:hypothetical protein